MAPLPIADGLFDTHLHLATQDDAAKVLTDARAAGVQQLLIVGSDLQSSRQSLAIAEHNPLVYASAGIHPHEASRCTEDTLTAFTELWRQPQVIAVGEIGLDYYYNHSDPTRQCDVLETFLDAAVKHNLPAIIHCRDAFEDCISILKNVPPEARHFEIHSFSGTPDVVDVLLEMGAVFSFNGMVTFKKTDNIREALRQIPLDRLLLETDSPYLAPVPHRGHRNTPAYLPLIAERVAKEHGCTPEEIARITTENANRFFGIPQSAA